MRNVTAVALLALCLTLPSGAAGQPAVSAEISALRAEIAALTERLDRLERRTPADASAEQTAAAAPRIVEPRAEAVTVPNVRFSGDLRYRHESIDEEAVAERHRHRIRGRFGVTADVASNVRLGLTLATGGDDPVSANQTLDTGFDRKSIGVDRAFFSWAVTDELTLTGGKMANPFFRAGNHHLIYDGDLNPEGFAVRYARGDWFASSAGLWVEERGAADDSIMLGGQFGYRRSLERGVRVTAGASYYDYRDTQGRAPFFDGAPAGNRVDASGNYLSDFDIAELFGQFDFTIRRRPLSVFADYVVNTAAQSAEKGFALGASFGEVTGPRTWRIGYAYQDLEADAVVGTFTDSDFAGGGTDGKGHVVELNYGLRDRLVLGLKLFSNERGADSGNEHDFDRLQADVSFNY